MKLRARFFSVGYKDIDDVLVPLLESQADSSISPRVFPFFFGLLTRYCLPTLGTLLSHKIQLINEAGMSELRQGLLKNFTEVVLKIVSKLQLWNDAKPDTS